MLETTPKKRRDTTSRRSTAVASTGQNRQDERDTVTPQPLPTQELREPRLEKIARRAHEIYERRGGTHGKDLDDWLQAEREIDAEME